MKLKKLFLEDLDAQQLAEWNKAFRHPRAQIAKWFHSVRDHLEQLKSRTDLPDLDTLLKKNFDDYMRRATPYEGMISTRKIEHLINRHNELEFHVDDDFSHDGWVTFKIYPDSVECDIFLPDSIKEKLIKMINELKWSLYDVL